MKIAIIGAGNVGAMTASRVVDAGLADVALIDILPGLAKGKALDISDARPITGSRVIVSGSEDFSDLKGSDIVVVTAGLARKPGMSRDDLLNKNAQIIRDIALKIKNFCPQAIIIVVTNPLDVMSYLLMKTAGLNPQKVMGMAGVLDTARFINILREKNKDIDEDKFLMMGSHGDTMVPVSRSKKISGSVFKEASEMARNRGAEIVKYLGTGSAYFAPSASVFFMLKAIIKDEKNVLCASAYLSGEYGEKDIYIGVPVILGSQGIERIIETGLSEQEKKAFKESAIQIREGISKTL